MAPSLSTENLPTTYRRGFEPGFLGRIAQMHGEFYAKVWGSGVGFEVIMARQLCDFYERYDTNRDLLLTAHAGGAFVGSMAVDGTQTERPGLARLRWYLVDERYQGRGIGRKLLEDALEFCQDRGFGGIYLWTVEGLPQSIHLYEKAGFQIVRRLVDSRYTVEHTQLMLERAL